MRRRRLLAITVIAVVAALLVLSLIITTMRYTPRHHAEERPTSWPGPNETATPVQPPPHGTR